jgi:UDP-N-acetylmuramoylalanine--D-glutamate ligase
MELFAQALRALGTSGYQPKVLAITGTNGKTTTTSLTGLLCERAGKKVAVAGNISPAMLDRLASAIDETALPDVWVLELSSFQLETARTFAPTPPRAQHHAGPSRLARQLRRLRGGQGRIFGATTTRVLNRDDAAVMVAPAAGAADAARTVTFGLGEPTRAATGCRATTASRGSSKRSTATRRTKRRRPAGASATARNADIAHKRLMPADACASAGCTTRRTRWPRSRCARDRPAGCAAAALREYRGEPHRVEVVATIDDVEYFDDSKGTNVGATVAALDGLAQKIVLIAGGDGKGQDFAPLVAPVARYAAPWC